MKEQVKNICSGIAGSYSQVFFSNNSWLALFLLLASFIDPAIGLSGLICVLCAILAARCLGLNPAFIRNGWYTYNVLLTGMAMGANFQFTPQFIIMLIIASMLCLLLSVWLASYTARYRLPFLSIPFILSVWILFLNARSFQTNLLIERNVYLDNNAYSSLFRTLSSGIEKSGLHPLILNYFKSMSSIFFQDKLISGVLISIGLLISSRITFFLSWLGFLSGYLYFRLTLGHAAHTEYLSTGFNYIFSGVALAGFYLVPSLSSFALVIVTVPVLALVNTALSGLIGPTYLPLYSLPFSLVVIIIISVLNNRYSFKKLDLVQLQLYSPEKNLYAFNNYMERFKRDTLTHIHLPFYGEWNVSQGHSGKHTHKEEWRFALDFVVTDEHNQTFKLPGKNLGDFYCYSLPVLAPADGQVTTVEDGIEDNMIGDVNLDQNWGNTIVIKHSDFLYSKISHLKKDSIKIKTGDQVKRGDLIAQCGSSGRSPEPHIHFQLQNTPYIGAPTIEYPISYYISRKKETFTLHTFEHPKEGELILRPIATPLLKKAFHFIPGMKLNFEVENETGKSTEEWEVITDAYNNSYLHCAACKSSAHFTNNQTLFYFTGFTGNKNSLLYSFYLAAYKVLLSYVPGLETKDTFPVETSTRLLLKPLQDLIAPFYIFIKPAYKATFKESAKGQAQENILIQSRFSENGNQTSGMDFEIELADNKIKTFKITKNNLCTVATNIG